MGESWFDYYIVGSLRDTWDWGFEVGRVIVQPKVIWVWLGAFVVAFLVEHDEPFPRRLMESLLVAVAFIGLLALILFAAPLLGAVMGR